MRIAPLMNFAENDPMLMKIGPAIRPEKEDVIDERAAAMFTFEKIDFSKPEKSEKKPASKAGPVAFKVGDMVRVVRLPHFNELWGGKINTGEQLLAWKPMVGKKSVVSRVDITTAARVPAVGIDGSCWLWPVQCLELVREDVPQIFEPTAEVRVVRLPEEDVEWVTVCEARSQDVGKRFELVRTGEGEWGKYAVLDGSRMTKWPLCCLEVVLPAHTKTTGK